MWFVLEFNIIFLTELFFQERSGSSTKVHVKVQSTDARASRRQLAVAASLPEAGMILLRTAGKSS
jgi:hypothetical protein